MKSRWTKRALTALTSIHGHIAGDNPPAADALRDRTLAFVETTLTAHPSIGRPGRVDGTRESVIHPSYIIVYRVTGEVVEILTVRHVAQKWPEQF
jgi:addiction module RelE/StbE family toxin